jgi:hypothetical protein
MAKAEGREYGATQVQDLPRRIADRDARSPAASPGKPHWSHSWPHTGSARRWMVDPDPCGRDKNKGPDRGTVARNAGASPRDLSRRLSFGHRGVAQHSHRKSCTVAVHIRPPDDRQWVYDCIVARTREGLGQPVHPHLFRDSATTSIAIDDPKHIGIASRLLGHRNQSTTERYYNQAPVSKRAGACKPPCSLCAAALSMTLAGNYFSN